MKKFIGIVLFLFLLSPLFGAIYYVDATTGDNSDTGLTEELAWETWNHVRAQSFSAGDTIKFKRGETWIVGANEYWDFTDSGNSGAYITVEDYDEGVKPIFDAEIEMVAATWAEEASSDIEQLVNDDFWTVETNTCQKIKVTTAFAVIEASVLMYKGTTGNAHIEFWTEGTSDAGATMSGDSVQIGGDSAVVSIDQAGATWFDFAWTTDCPHLTADCFMHVVEEGGTLSIRSSTDETDYEDTDYDLWRLGSEIAGHNDLAFKISAAPIWSTAWTVEITRCRLDGVDSYTPDAAGSIDGITYLWHWNTDDDKLFVYAEADPDGFYTSVKVASNNNWVFYMNGCDYIRIQNVRMHSAKYGVRFHATTDETYIEFNDCDIWYGYIGVWCSKTAGGGGTANYITIDGCDIDSKVNLIADTGIDETERCMSDGIDVDNEADNWTIKNSTITDWGHNGIAFIAYTSSSQGTNNNVVESNVFDGSNSPYMRAISFGGIDGKCTDNIFRYNTDQHTTVRNQFGGNDNEVYYNIIYDKNDVGIDDKDDVSEGLRVEVLASGVCDGIKIYNNMIYDTYNESMSVGDAATNCEVKNNIYMKVDSAGAYPNICIYAGASVGANNVVSNNCFFDANTTTVVDWEGATYTVIAADAGLAEFSSNLGLDPNMIDPAGADFRLLMASLCINAGTDVGLTRDYRGRSIRHAPDIGAYEDPTNAIFMSAELLSFSDLWLLWNDKLKGLAWWEELGVYLKEEK